MTVETILANATLVLPNGTMRGQIRFDGGLIADLAEGTSVPKGPSTARAIW